MNLLPSDPHKRRFMFLSALAMAAVLGLGILSFQFLAPSAPEAQEGASSAAVSESAVRALERDLNALQEELKQGFYRTRKPYRWTPDTAAPGKMNPFVK